MKATTILKWCIENNIYMDECKMGLINVPIKEEQTPEWWDYFFGAIPTEPLEEGEYFYMYSDTGGGQHINSEEPTTSIDEEPFTIDLYKLD